MASQPKDVEAIFNAALEKETEAARLVFLDETCADDRQLYARVAELLRYHSKVGGFLETPPPAIASPVGDTSLTEGPGTVIGRYKLLELIGEGGFGLVYMAEQQEPVRRQVALKIIKLGMDTKQVIARFDAERQALALMDHPNIAKVLDAGATDSGRPCFVMELVRGIAITDYCDGNNLTTKERLKLFIDVCQAVQHAHQKGIIHRDVKPTNVMVTQQDGRPVPKVIDFGIAKATEHRLTEKTLYTTYRQLIGTPEYMSPEQATFCEADIDTRSDIYSLGVLLYELLVGTTPFDAEALRSRGYDEICRVIRESDPPTPSRRLSTMGEVVSEISKHRHVEPAALRKLLRGDVDWIVMKALDKDRRRRYETVHGLARDIERHLSHEPVRARPPSAGYRLKKFVRKHRVAVAATVAVVGALVVGLTLTTLGFVRADRERRIATAERDRANAERDRAKENLQLARQLVSDVIWPATQRMSDFAFAQAYRHEVLEKARVFYEQILKQAGDDPEPRREMAQIHCRLGDLMKNTGQDAEPAYRRSLSILEDLVREFPSDPSYRSDLGNSHGGLATWFGADLRFREAVEERRIALGIAQDLAAEFPSNEVYRKVLANDNWAVGWYLVRVGKFAAAEKYNRAAVTASERLPVFSRVISRYFLAHLLMRLARYDEAEQVVQEALEIAEQHLAPSASPPNAGWVSKIVWLAHSHRNVGLLHFYTGRFEDAEGHLRKAIDPAKRWYDRLSLSVDGFPTSAWHLYYFGWWYHDLAETLTAMGRLEEAEEARRLSLAAWESASTPVAAIIPHGKGLAHYRLGELLHRTGQTEEAGRQFVQAKATMEDLARRRPNESACHWQIICLLANCPDPALRDPRRAVTLAKQVLPARAGHYWRYLALAQYRSGDWQDAADSIQQAMDLRQGGDAFDWFLLAMAQWQLGQKEKALERYTQAQEAIEASKPIYYEYIGVMAVDRLRSEAEMLLGERTENPAPSTQSGRRGSTAKSNSRRPGPTPGRLVCTPGGEASLIITQTVLGVDLSVMAAWLPRRMEGFLMFRHLFTAMALGCVVLMLAAASTARATTILIDDFNDGNDDGWVRADTLGTAGPGIWDASSGEYHIESTGPTNDPWTGVSSWWEASLDPFFSNGFLRMKVRPDSPGGSVGPGMRGHDRSGSWGAYYFLASGWSHEFSIAGQGEEWEQFYMPNVRLNAGEEWIIEGGIVGDQLSMKVWRPGDPEPASPQLMMTDPEPLPLGGFGVLSFISTGSPPVRNDATFDDIYFTSVSDPLLGDVNLDDEVNGLDVDPFVDVLLSDPYKIQADMNLDAVVNGLDVDPFVAAVVGGSAQEIPEPSTLLLALIALGVVDGWRKGVSYLPGNAAFG